MPGIYDLTLDTPEARIVRNAMSEIRRRQDTVIVIVDASNLSRNLVLVGSCLAAHTRMIVCLNMTDVATRRGLTVDSDALSDRLGVPVVKMVASKGDGVQALRLVLGRTIERDSHIEAKRANMPPAGAPHRALVDWARGVAEAATGTPPGHDPASRGFTERLDRILTHPVSGFAVFVVVMGGLFWALFALAAVPMDLIDSTFATLNGLVRQYLPAGAVRDLLTDGVIGGIAEPLCSCRRFVFSSF
jgi:ferrous iron transport protein B